MSAERQETKHDLVIAVYKISRRQPEGDLLKFVSELLVQADQSGFENPKVLVGVHHSVGDHQVNSIQDSLATKFDAQAELMVGNHGTKHFGSGDVYLRLLHRASNLGKYVLEIDAGGTHSPDDFGKIIDPLKSGKYSAVLGSRFTEGGQDYYPWHRQAASIAVTLLSNQLLHTKLKDAASGYESFTSEVLRKIFDIVPPDEWITYNGGPLHIYQTEMRAYVAWIGEPFIEVPIKYGEGKKGKRLPSSYYLCVPKALIQIAKMRERFKDS